MTGHITRHLVGWITCPHCGEQDIELDRPDERHIHEGTVHTCPACTGLMELVDYDCAPDTGYRWSWEAITRAEQGNPGATGASHA